MVVVNMVGDNIPERIRIKMQRLAVADIEGMSPDNQERAIALLIRSGGELAAEIEAHYEPKHADTIVPEALAALREIKALLESLKREVPEEIPFLLRKIERTRRQAKPKPKP